MSDELREKVAQELFYMDTGTLGGTWDGENEHQKKGWRECADKVIALVNGGGLIKSLNNIKQWALSVPPNTGWVNELVKMVDAALSAYALSEKPPKPTDIAGDHTGMHWDGLAGVWRRDAAPRDESKEGGR
jgi:hypothetical protein